ncbi:hypothetical protein QZH41_011207, partial [Actinostola sp. cb2023]
MRNTEQLLKNVGLWAYNVGSLKECNEKLAEYGPENITYSRISVITKPGQHTAVERHNISVCSFSGSTERQILNDIEAFVDKSLPLKKMELHFNSDGGATKEYILKKIVFCHDRQKRARNFTTDNYWQMTPLYVTLVQSKRRLNYLDQVCTEWREIASILRDKVFKEDEEDCIDVFDVKCKEWGFLLLEMCGKSLGTGDYGHLTIEHASMLLRMHRSLCNLSNQGFEASHKLQRQLYLKATSHDSNGNTESLNQIFTHVYMQLLLELRLSFREATNCISTGKPFYYRGCGWKNKCIQWTENDKSWITIIDKMFNFILGPDLCKYEYTKEKTCVLQI